LGRLAGSLADLACETISGAWGNTVVTGQVVTLLDSTEGGGMLPTGGMDATLIRQLIQRRLWDGRLPHDNSVELSCGPGTRQTCDGCSTPILPHDTMTLRIDAEDGREMRFHQECFEIWDEERVKDRQRRHSHPR